jgi:hypothetical protein
VPGTTCPAFPSDSIFNRDISTLPVLASSSAWVASGAPTLDFDFGPYADWGMPYNVVNNTHSLVTPSWGCCGDQSDPGPYPFGADTLVQSGGGGDGHALMINGQTCTLFELYAAAWNNGSPTAGGGAIWTLTSNALRPDGWTSTDDAGLPVFPLLVRYEDVQSGALRHAIRFTLKKINNSTHLWPARFTPTYDPSTVDPSYVGSSDPSLPPMGTRLRLQAGYDISSFSQAAQVILNGLKHYGMYLADWGNDWSIHGTSDTRWSAGVGSEIQTVPIAAFEAVDTSSLLINKDSGQALQ